MVNSQAKRVTLLDRGLVTDKIKIERFLVYFVFFFTLFTESVLLPSALSFCRYINDVAVLLLFVLSLGRIKNTFETLKCKQVLYCIVIFTFASVFSAIINLTPVNMFVWGARNTFRGIVFFIACVCYLDGIDLNKIFKILFWVQIVNFLSAILQFAFLGLSGDSMGGIFGAGSNVSLGAFNALVYVYFFIAYVKGKENFLRTAIMFFSSIIITALAEEKFGILFCAFTLIITMFVKGDGKRKFYLFVSVLLTLFLGLILLGALYPDSLKKLLSIKELFSYSKATYDEGYMIPRLGGVAYISEKFFKGDPLKILFGLGLGNCDTSQFSFFQSEFYSLYGHYNYRWFSHQWIFLEGGLVGLCCFLSIFVVGFICMIKRLKNLKRSSAVYCLVGAIMAFYSCVTVWGSSLIKTDFSYVVYFAFAVGIISLKPVVLMKKKEGKLE